MKALFVALLALTVLAMAPAAAQTSPPPSEREVLRLRLKDLKDGAEGTIIVPAPKHDIVVSLTPTSGTLIGAPTKHKLIYAGAPQPPPAQPNLYFLAIGVDTYQNADEFPRTYAKADIDGVVETVKRQEGVFFGHVDVTTLLDDEVTIDRVNRSSMISPASRPTTIMSSSISWVMGLSA